MDCGIRRRDDVSVQAAPARFGDSTCGTQASKQLYSAFCACRYTSGSLPTNFKYTGQRADSLSGLYYYNARYSNPATGRFIQPDSIVPQPYNPSRWDRYAYVNNNPINRVDPTGHMDIGDTNENGCSGQGPKCIIQMYMNSNGYDSSSMEDSLRAFIENHPDYQIESDPLIYGQNEEFLVRTAQFQVQVENLNVDFGDGTFQVGLGGAAFIGPGVRGDISLGVDGKGNLGVFLGFGSGIWTAGGINRVGPFITHTNAPSINKLTGYSVQAGGQFGIPVSLGGEYVVFKDDQ